jgi:transcriptional regulator with XRE-family HTH domain
VATRDPRRSTAEADAFIGDRVRSCRLQARMSQEQLGEALGISFQQIQKYEKGTNRIGAGRLLRIAEVLGCDIMEFFTGISTGQISMPLSNFMATADGIAIMEAMSKIKNPALRRTVIEIAEKLADL